MKKYHSSFKIKKKLIHIPNYKLNRIIDRTYRPFNVFPRNDKTHSTSFKKNRNYSFPASYNEK